MERTREQQCPFRGAIPLILKKSPRRHDFPEGLWVEVVGDGAVEADG
jgi:hypothetical protein